MKKVINILLMAAMAAGTLAGCGGKSSESHPYYGGLSGD